MHSAMSRIVVRPAASVLANVARHRLGHARILDEVG
jgi:hypothetical protein